MTIQMDKKELETFSKFCETALIQRFKSLSRTQDVEISPTSEHSNSDELSKYISIIFIISKGVKISFTAYYTLDEIRNFVSNAYSAPPEAVTPAQMTDFVKEYCNLCGGAVKKSFETDGNQLAMSLPIVTRGQDDIFFKKDRKIALLDRSFQIKNEESSLTINVLIEVFDKITMKSLFMSALGIDDSEGDVEFFDN